MDSIVTNKSQIDITLNKINVGHDIVESGKIPQRNTNSTHRFSIDHIQLIGATVFLQGQCLDHFLRLVEVLSAGSRIAMTSCSNMDIPSSRGELDVVVPDVRPITREQIHRQNASLHILVVRLVLSVDLHHRSSVAASHSSRAPLPVVQCGELQIEIARQRVHVHVDVVDAQTLQRVESIPQTGNAQKVDRAVLKATARTTLRITPRPRPHVEHAEVLLVARDRHSASSPVELVEDVDVLVPHQKSPQSCGEAEHLVEGERDEVRLVFRQVESVGGHERRGVEENEPLVTLAMRRGERMHVVEVAVLDLLDPAERVFHAGEVVLRSEGEKTVGVVVVFVAEHLLQIALADEGASLVVRQILLVESAEATAKAEGVLANAQHGVVILWS